MINADTQQVANHTPQISLDCTPQMIGPSCAPETNGYCATCSNEAIPATVLSVDAATGLALVELNHATGEIDITRVENVAPGAILLIHDGIAIANLSATVATKDAT